MQLKNSKRRTNNTKKERATIKVYDKFGNYMSLCKPKRAEQLIARGNAIESGENEITLLILRDDFKKIREYVYERDNYECHYCGCRCTKHNISLDHLLPRSRGGSDFPDNLVASCINCNERKKDMDYNEFFWATYVWLLSYFSWHALCAKKQEKQRKREKYLKRIGR